MLCDSQIFLPKANFAKIWTSIIYHEIDVISNIRGKPIKVFVGKGHFLSALVGFQDGGEVLFRYCC